MPCSTAILWYQQSLDYGYEDSLDPLAEIYLSGYGQASSLAASKSLMSQIAGSGDVTSQYNLGYMHYIGNNAKKDHQLAAKWFLKAAMQGDADSQYMLGKMHLNGEGIKQDLGRCYLWSKLADQGGHEEASLQQAQCGEKLSDEALAKIDTEIRAVSAKITN